MKIVANTKHMRRFSSREVTMSSFLDVQKVEKNKSLIIFKCIEFQLLLHRLPSLYRLQNLAVETLDLESRAFLSTGL